MNAHEALLSEWARREHHVGKGFIKDGIIDPSRWSTARRKVLLLLKEAYGEHKGEPNWDLREVIRQDWKGPRYPIWHQAAYWCYAAQNTSSHDQRFPTKEAAAAALLHASFINIKKSNGSSASNEEDIREHAKRDHDLIKRQIQLISPEIIICGSTWQFIEHLFEDPQEVYDWVYKAENFYIINFWHPANRFPHDLNYYALVCVLQNGQV